jgi:fatty-acid desaturase
LVAGVAAYILLARRWRSQGAPMSALLELFFVFFCYGGLLLVALTSFFGQWSGAASLGMFFLLLAAPPAMIGMAIRFHRLSAPHPSQRRLRFACIWYVPSLIITTLLLVTFDT